MSCVISETEMWRRLACHPANVGRLGEAGYECATTPRNLSIRDRYLWVLDVDVDGSQFLKFAPFSRPAAPVGTRGPYWRRTPKYRPPIEHYRSTKPGLSRGTSLQR
jgi:hypothetical protein